MSNPNKVNFFKLNDGLRLRVTCPDCEIGGAHYIENRQPKCHGCGTALMQPASNNKIECTWEEFESYVNENGEAG